MPWPPSLFCWGEYWLGLESRAMATSIKKSLGKAGLSQELDWESQGTVTLAFEETQDQSFSQALVAEGDSQIGDPLCCLQSSD